MITPTTNLRFNESLTNNDFYGIGIIVNLLKYEHEIKGTFDVFGKEYVVVSANINDEYCVFSIPINFFYKPK